MMLEKSDSFCMYPWIHLHTTPTGVAAPCCIAESTATEDGVGNSRAESLINLVNSEKMSKLRLDMLHGIKNPECIKCHMHEAQGVTSARQYANKEFAHVFDEALQYTNLDNGTLSHFEMKYFDVRFSNICNFKCRTCNSMFSTQWEQEDLKSRVPWAKLFPKNDNKQFLQDVVDQIPYIEVAYFAGGEPLITEEHYILLEEMIKQGKTNIKLRYNTNLSNLKFKNKDLLSLWQQFKYPIDIYASIDHYGERAEYIRHGTDWGQVETNFLSAKSKPFISLQINTVLSVFNLLTIDQFYQYLIDKKMYTVRCNAYQLYNMSTPEHIACHILPNEYKLRGKEAIENSIKILRSRAFSELKISQLSGTLQWIFSRENWEEQKMKFRSEVMRIDQIRGEKFDRVFPELAPLLKEPRPKRILHPV